MAKKPAPGSDGKRWGATGPSLTAGCRAVLLVGPEHFLHVHHTEALRTALTAAHGRVGVFQFDGAGADAAAVLDECRTFGLMEPHKLVIVDNTDQFLRSRKKPEDANGNDGGGDEEDRGDQPAESSRHRELLERYLQSPCEGATLLLRSEKGFTLGRLKALIEKAGAVVRCALVDPETDKGPTGRALSKEAANRLAATRAAEWAVRRAAEAHDATLTPDAAELLVERIGPHMSRLDSELEKLALNLAGAGPVTIGVKSVAEMVGKSREEEVWIIQSALLSGDAGAAIGSIRQALDVSRHHPVLISWACVDLARKLHGASRGMAAGMDPWKLKGALRLWGDSADPILAAARRVRPADAAALLREAVEADARQKSGADPERTLETLALRFAAV